MYKAVTNAIHAGYKLDHNRTTWGLSQFYTSTALHILSSLPHAMYTNAQQYVDRCVEDAWAAQSTQPRTLPQPKHEKQTLWTTLGIADQVEQWAYHPHTVPTGLRAIRPGAYRLADVMACWGKKEGLTAVEVTRAIQAQCNATGTVRFMVNIEGKHMVIAVVNTPPIGQADRSAQATKHRTNPPSEKW